MWVEGLFTSILAITLIVEIDLIYHNLNFSNNFLKLWGVIILLCLAFLIQVRANILARDVAKGNRELFSHTSKKYLSIVKRCSFITLLPLFITIFSRQDNQQLFGIMVSAILIILFKDYLDRVITFFPKGYSSGFVEIKFNLNMKVKKIQERIYPNMGNVVTFELYTENQYKGYDKFMEEEYLVLKDRLHNV